MCLKEGEGKEERSSQCEAKRECPKVYFIFRFVDFFVLPYNNRLIKRKDFERVGKSGRFFSEEYVAIKFLGNGLSKTRVGFVAGLKFSKKAVERNQVKRRLREIFQAHLLELQKGLDIVVMAKKRRGEEVSYEKLRQNVENLLKNCKAIARE